MPVSNPHIHRVHSEASHIGERAELKVAIVDDDGSVRAALSRLLSAHGIDCQTYCSARDFLAAMPFGEPDCLIVDVNMPGMTGIDLQRELVTLGIDIPTIVVTGHDGGSELLAMSLGAAAFLIKPFDGSVLIDAIGSAIKRRN